MSMRGFFKPVDQSTTTDTYFEIGRRRWEGLPAVILFQGIVVIPWALVLILLAILVLRG